MAAGKLDIVIEQDSDFKKELTLSKDGSAIDIAGWTFKSEVRKTKKGELLGTFAFTIINPTNGRVDMEMPKAETALINAGRYWYDVERVDGSGVKRRLMEGRALVTAEVTQV